MKKLGGNWRQGLILGILVVLVSLAFVGTAAAADTLTPDPHGHDGTTAQGTLVAGSSVPDNDVMETCEQMMGNTSWVSGGMMGRGGMMSAGSARMMESVEVNAMGGPMHDEMQGLVTRMMAGSLSSTDQARMVEIMNKYPGASNMMMTRMMGGNGQGWSGYPGMMGSYGQNYGMMGTGGVYSSAGMMGGAGMMDAGLMTGGSILIVLFFVVWLVVGILAIIWFVKQFQKDKGQP